MNGFHLDDNYGRLNSFEAHCFTRDELFKFIIQPARVTKHEFIFSDKRKPRITRHVAFWFVWCVAFTLLFYFPTYTFKGWGPHHGNRLQELGLPLFFIRNLIVYSFLGTVVPQIALTYVLIYWLLPNYY